MTKIIKGILYNTSTATLIGGNGYSHPGDLRYCYEALYRKKSGEYFLHGMGGPLSKYSKSVGTNETSGNEMIIPMTYAEARDWAEANLDADDYIAAFGTPEEDDNHVIVTVNFNKATYDMINREAASAGVTVDDYIERLVTRS